MKSAELEGLEPWASSLWFVLACGKPLCVHMCARAHACSVSWAQLITLPLVSQQTYANPSSSPPIPFQVEWGAGVSVVRVCMSFFLGFSEPTLFLSATPTHGGQWGALLSSKGNPLWWRRESWKEMGQQRTTVGSPLSSSSVFPSESSKGVSDFSCKPKLNC